MPPLVERPLMFTTFEDGPLPDMPPLVDAPLLPPHIVDGGGHLEELDDIEMDMPPLVDNPNPSMTFTFATDMTPITYSSDPTRFEVVSDAQAPDYSSMYSPPLEPSTPAFLAPDSPSKGRRERPRDPSYIPRPPNAFILFRSSFIKTHHVPGMGKNTNNCTLSKVIGKLWKELPPHEREYWEAKALLAQAEHRKKYPDWRFRPGANALAKARIKDGGGGSRRRRKGRGGEAADGRAKGKGRKARAPKEESASEKEGLETNAGGSARQNEKKPQEPIRDDEVRRGSVESDASATTDGTTSDKRFDVPLTAMFRRSSSAPASDTRVPFPSPSPTVPMAPPMSPTSVSPLSAGEVPQLLANTTMSAMLRRNSIAVVPPAEMHHRGQHILHSPYSSSPGRQDGMPSSPSPVMSFTEMLEDPALPPSSPSTPMSINRHGHSQVWPEMPGLRLLPPSPASPSTDTVSPASMYAYDAAHTPSSPLASPLMPTSEYRPHPVSSDGQYAHRYTPSPAYSSLDGWAGHTQFIPEEYNPTEVELVHTPGYETAAYTVASALFKPVAGSTF
ncbi:hypothetical protein PUNSTDRAFT_52685 [Punctularia strigosozonata HHB-11173 SS5]|uniref:uncharacterized protein n=1 Tax=Punctularia strigosozonata (strain HHB-11173) TaxID=741275 RepID=UPI00044176AF|nr:uncharacterized protein PUNSTDRAFT_52685 [Punctularia strigosozonata HHB-11173 SS5]EIN08227.1 hypothetical protein PUNSTDRAFT_52685 [Punctularia strigosozonata HHB-11173 SS5]